MSYDGNDSLTLADKPAGLELALEQSKNVQAKVEECADDLSSANQIVKKKIAEGATTLPAHNALANNQKVESKVQQCADDLHDVAESLTQGIEDLKETEIALSESQKALADTQAALVVAQEGEKHAQLRALYDSTTELPNRDLFNERLAHAVTLAKRHQWTVAVLFLDLDDFKSINEMYGHEGGDLVLKEVANRLLQHCREEDTVCRNGGDEFLCLLVNPQGPENIERISRAILERIAQPIAINDEHIVVKTSIGSAVYPITAVEQLITNADAAMYRAKARKSGYVSA